MKKTILVTTYAVNPYKGSEDGMGWNYVKQIARFNKVIAITRENNREAIERFMRENPDPIYENIQFEYHDLPYWMRWWKKGHKLSMIYFWMWQKSIPSFVTKKKLQFDICHNLNFHNDWTPTYLWKLNKPFVWGPIGHHPRIPKQFLKDYKTTELIKDRLTWMIKNAFWKWSPALKNATKKADFILCMNSSVPHKIDVSPGKHWIKPSVASEDFGFESTQTDRFRIISAGRLVALKGFDLTIKAYARFISGLGEEQKAKCELLIVGKGPNQNLYADMVEQFGIQNQVKFIPWIERAELMRLMKSASVFMFPSHEGAGMVVPEALSHGIPVLCLDNVGPGEFVDDTCAMTVACGSYEETVDRLSNGLSRLYFDPEKLASMKRNARRRFENIFHWDLKGTQLLSIYQKI